MRKSGIFDPRSVGYNSFCNSLGREKPSSLTQLALPISKLHLLSETATYWSFLQKSILESSEILLVGYSGLDVHLNDLISSLCETKNIRVVEWSGCGEFVVRGEFWFEQLGKEIELIHLDNILEFTEWEYT